MAGRPSHAKALAIWMNGLRVGEWRMPTRGPMELAYDPSWLAAEEARPLSLSLPLPLSPIPLTSPAVERYFDNLLPDYEPLRRRIASRFRLGDISPFTLLSEIGRDCVGAVQLLPVDAEAPQVRRIDVEPLDDTGVEQILHRAATPTGGMATFDDNDDEELRISIAGAQDKTALLWHEGRWCRPLGATPTTHLFKLPLGLIGGQRGIDFSTSVDNEWLCLRLLRLFELPVPDAQIGQFGLHRALIVERFDRRLMPAIGRRPAWWARLPQEDFCQVFGLPPTAKYERDGGPGMVEIAARLQGSVEGQFDVQRFLAVQILFWMLAAIDGHAKNFSLQLLPQGRYRLTPFYDVLSAWPAVGAAPSQINPHKAEMAMSFRGKSRHRKILNIQRRHFTSTAQLGGLESAEPLVEYILARTPEVIAQAQRDLPTGFSQKVLDRVLRGLSDMADKLAAESV